VFCRFAGCNLWSGRENDRERAICRFCDTDFIGSDGPGGGKFSHAQDLASAIARHWPSLQEGRPYVVCTGGEPLLQVDVALIAALHRAGFEVAVESNGTYPAPLGLDWICVSPKAGTQLHLCCGDELKLVYPQAGLVPEDFIHLDFKHFLLQPMDGPARDENTHAAVEYCLRHPRWRLSLQTHKWLGIR